MKRYLGCLLSLGIIPLGLVASEADVKTKTETIESILDLGVKILNSTEAVGVKVLETGATAVLVPASAVTEAAKELGLELEATRDYLVFGKGEKFSVVDKALDGAVGAGSLVLTTSAEIAFLGAELALTIANNGLKIGTTGLNVAGQSQYLAIKGLHDLSTFVRNGFHEEILVPTLIQVENVFKEVDCAINEDWKNHDENRDAIIEACPALAPLAFIGNLLFKAPGAVAKVSGGALSVAGTIVVEGGRAINCVVDGGEEAVVLASQKLSELFEVPDEGWENISSTLEEKWEQLRSDLNLQADEIDRGLSSKSGNPAPEALKAAREMYRN